MPDRRAVLIAVSKFPEPLRDLPFAVDGVVALAQVLEEHFDYPVTVIHEPDLTSAKLDAVVEVELRRGGPDTMLIVHVLSHGFCHDRGHLFVAGADGEENLVAEVGRWISIAQRDGGPTVLFLLDMCQSGLVTRLPWLDDYEGERRHVWTLTASDGDQRAFDGRFTLALADVLGDMARADLETSAPMGFLPLEVIAQAVRDEVDARVRRSGALPQQVTGTRVDISQDTRGQAPFFPHPATRVLRPAPPSAEVPVLAALARELDEGMDLPHFLERASGRGAPPSGADELAGCFTGHRRHLSALSHWLTDDDTQGPCVVEGGPGTGKSAIVGVFVCAAHVRLREPTKALWQRALRIPPIDSMAVVHARGLDLDALVTSIGRQLGIGEDLSPTRLLEALRPVKGRPPVLVIDSLEESQDIAEVAAWLSALARLTRIDGTAAVRLLVAARSEDAIAPLRALALSTGCHLTMDTVDSTTLEGDLRDYIAKLVNTVPRFQEAGPVVDAFATAVSLSLTRDRSMRSVPVFITAAIHTRRFLETFDLRKGGLGARQLGNDVPQGVPELFESDLHQTQENPWLRPALTVLAYARGPGMPTTVIARIAAAIAPHLPAPSAQDISDVLDLRTFYVRRSSYAGQPPVYRLYHDELAAYLRGSGTSGGVLNPLLSALGPPEARNWSVAEPYVLRYALAHADGSAEEDALFNDPGFLLYADPDTYRSSHAAARHDRLLRLLSNELDQHLRREALALAAAQAGNLTLARRVAELPGESPLPWQPLWTAGTFTTDTILRPAEAGTLTRRGVLRVGETEITGVSSFVLAEHQGRAYTVVGLYDGRVGELSSPDHELARHRGPVKAVAALSRGDELVIISGGSDGEVRRNGVPVFASSSSTGIDKLAWGGADPVVIACADASGEVSLWQEAPSHEVQPLRWKPASPARSVAVGIVDGRPTAAVGCSDGTVCVYDFLARTPGKVLRDGRPGPILSICFAVVGGRTVVVAGAEDGGVRFWDVLTGRLLKEHCFNPGLGPVRALGTHSSSTILSGLLGADNGVLPWELRPQEAVEWGQPVSAHAVADVALIQPGYASEPAASVPPEALRLVSTAVHQVHGHAVVVLGDEDGGLRCVDATTGIASLNVPGIGEPTLSLSPTVLAGRPAVYAWTESARRIWDLVDGAIVDQRPKPAERGKPDGSPSAQVIVDGDLLTVQGQDDGTVLSNGKPLGTHDSPVTAVVTYWLDNCPIAVTGSRDGMVRRWNLSSSELLDELRVRAPVFALAYLGTGRLLVGAGGGVMAFRRSMAPAPQEGQAQHPPRENAQSS